MRRLILLFALVIASCSTALYDFGHSAPIVVEKRDCRVVTGKGETANAWFLMSKDATLYLDRKTYDAIHVGQEVCGPWKDKEAQPQKFERPAPDCFLDSDQRCQQPNKA